MEKYQSYKSSGVEWIGEIPEGWILNKIKHHSQVNVGLVINPSTYFDDNGTIPIITGKNVQTTGIDLTNVDFITEQSNDLLIKTQIFEGDIVSMRVGYPGRSCVIKEKENGINCCSLIITRKSNSILSEFLVYQLNTSLGIVQVQLCQGGMGQQVVNLSDWREFFVVTPPLQEQNQIVQFLDEKTELIDKLISTKERKITLLKEQRTSLINQVVTKGLNPNVKMKDSGVEWIGEIPEGWVVSKFKFVSEIVTGNTPSKTDGGDYYSGEGFLWIKPTYLKGDKYVNDSDEKLTELGKKQTRVIPKDSIMICCIGNTIGKYGMSGQEVSTNQQINSVIPNKSKIIPWYCLYFVDVFTRDLLNRSNFVTLPILTKSDLENIEIIIPTLEEQVCIVEIINSKTKEIDDLVQLEQKKIDLLKEYRKSLISEVVTGKIKVTTDE